MQVFVLVHDERRRPTGSGQRCWKRGSSLGDARASLGPFRPFPSHTFPFLRVVPRSASVLLWVAKKGSLSLLRRIGRCGAAACHLASLDPERGLGVGAPRRAAVVSNIRGPFGSDVSSSLASENQSICRRRRRHSEFCSRERRREEAEGGRQSKKLPSFLCSAASS